MSAVTQTAVMHDDGSSWNSFAAPEAHISVLVNASLIGSAFPLKPTVNHMHAKPAKSMMQLSVVGVRHSTTTPPSRHLYPEPGTPTVPSVQTGA